MTRRPVDTSTLVSPPLASRPLELLTPTIEQRSAISLTVLHVDQDVELIARVAGQRLERLAVP